MIPLKLTRAHSPTKDTGRVFGWLVSEGEEVRTGQPVVEIELGRVTMELEAPGNGVLHILVQRGETVTVGGTLAEIRSQAEIGAAAAPAASPAAEESEPEPASEPEPEPPPVPAVVAQPEVVPTGATEPEAAPTGAESALATPAARRLAEEVGVDLAEVVGTGPDGRILAEDVEKLVASRPATQMISTIETAESAATPPDTAPAAVERISASVPPTGTVAPRSTTRWMIPFPGASSSIVTRPSSISTTGCPVLTSSPSETSQPKTRPVSLVGEWARVSFSGIMRRPLF